MYVNMLKKDAVASRFAEFNLLVLAESIQVGALRMCYSYFRTILLKITLYKGSLLGSNAKQDSILLASTLTGLVEPIVGLLGVSLVLIAKPILPWGLAFAAGAMLFVISDEIIP